MNVDNLTNKIDTKAATDRLSKTQSGALIVLFTAIIVALLGIIIWISVGEKKELKKEKDGAQVECQTAKTQLQNAFDSLRRINENLHDTVVEYRMFRKFNVQAGQKEIIITPKKEEAKNEQ